MPTNKPRISVTVDEKLFKDAQYWADKKGMSMSEYLTDALIKQIQHETSDFDVPNLALQRLNQLIETTEVLSSDIESLENMTTKGFNSLIGLTRGNNYLLSQEDTGELDE